MRERESGRRRSRTYLRTVRAEQVYACSPFPALPLNRTGFRIAVLGSSHSSKLFPPRPIAEFETALESKILTALVYTYIDACRAISRPCSR